jgi:large subunit ribosomal protein L10
MSVESLKAKQAVVDEIKEKLDRAQSAVVIDYMGINVEEANALRKQLREAGVDYVIYKNTLVRRAVKDTPYEELSGVLEGPSAFAFGYEDAVAPARELNNFIKKINKMEFKAGIVEGSYYDKEGITEIAKLPSRDELIAKFMGSIKSPVSKLAYLLQAIADQKASGAEPVKAAEAPAEPEAPAAESAPAESEAPAAEESAPAESEAPAAEETAPAEE